MNNVAKNNCKKCGKTFTCSCQKRQANDGETVCVNCITKYNKEIMISGVKKEENTKENK